MIEEEERQKQLLIEEEQLEIERERQELERLSKEMLDKEQRRFEQTQKEQLAQEILKKEVEEKRKAEQLRLEKLNMARIAKEIREKIDTPQNVYINSRDPDKTSRRSIAATSSKDSSVDSFEAKDITSPPNGVSDISSNKFDSDISSIYATSPSNPVMKSYNNNTDSRPSIKCIDSSVPSNKASFPLINYAEFETQNDPFDSVALKSINDLEELAEVLESSRVSNNQSNMNVNNMYGICQSSANQSVNNSSAIFSNPTYPVSNSYNYSKPCSTMNPFHQISSAASMSSNSGYIATLQYSTANNQSMASASANSTFLPSFDHTTTTASFDDKIRQNYNRPNTISNVEPTLLRPDLEDFYSKYYGDPNKAKKQEVPSIGNASSKSVPDLTEFEDTEASFRFKGFMVKQTH